jgi:hypothetical protein
MTVRTIAVLLGLAWSLGAGAAAAQQRTTVARLTNLEGSVLVSQGDAMVAATDNLRVPAGARVQTPRGARVVVSYDNGCSVTIKENERFTVGAGECCGAVAEEAPVRAGTAPAQPRSTVARLTNLQGGVLVSQDDAMVAATNNQRVPVGTRVLTPGGASVVINYDAGCDVTLKENERFTVAGGACCLLAAQVVPLGPAPGAIGGGVGVAGVTTTDVILGAAIIGGVGYGAYELFKRPSVSPN